MGNAQAAALPPGPRKPHIVPPGAYSVPGNPTMRANQQFYVVVPKGAYPGVEFPVLAGGYQLMVRCPDSCKAGDRIVVSAPHKKRNTESFLATVPDRINPGDHFAALINGRERIVTCPPGDGHRNINSSAPQNLYRGARVAAALDDEDKDSDELCAFRTQLGAQSALPAPFLPIFHVSHAL